MMLYRIIVNKIKASKDSNFVEVRLFACKEFVQCSAFVRFSKTIIHELNYGVHNLSSKERRYTLVNKDGMDPI